MTLERARTDYHKEEEFRNQYPHTLHALQNLIMAIVDYQKNQGKFSLFGKDKGLKVYQKFMESVRDTRDAMIMDKVINENASQSEFYKILLENIVVFSTIYPNWQDAYKYAFEYFGGADANTKQKVIPGSNKDAILNINELTTRLRIQREVWLKVAYGTLENDKRIVEKYNLSKLPALPIISAFQFAHVTHFINVKNYVDKKYYNDLFSKLGELSCTQPMDEWLLLVKQFESNMSLDIAEQIKRFCEDVAIAMMGSNAGIFYGLTFEAIAIKFIQRNCAIVAEHFGDTATAKN